MEPSSRTPEGEPHRCPLCGNALRIEPSRPPGDAPCPHCGHLLWFPERRPPKQGKLLIADEVATHPLWRACLSELKCEIQFVQCGQEALEWVDRFLPDVILLNDSLPGLSGVAVCRSLKERNATQSVMILIAVADNARLDAIEQAVASGADDFVTKPLQRSRLEKRVANLLKLKRVTDELKRLSDTDNR